MKKYLFISVLLAMNAFADGQSNFVSAVVINNNGDSIYGNIDYRNWKNNPKTINFTNSANLKQVFDASSIKGFYIPSVNETYTGFTVEIDMLPADQREAMNNSSIDSPVIKRRVFLLQLVKHPSLHLYLYTTRKKDHFYYVKGTEEPVELIHNYLFDESLKQVDENVKYKEQLSALFASCPGIVVKSKTIKFRKKEIQDIVVNYLQCSAPGSAIAVKKTDPVLVKFGIVAGIMFNQYKFEGTNELLTDKNYSSNVSPVLGISLDIGLSRNRNKWHIVNELIYKSYKTSSRFTRPFGNGYTVTRDIDLNFSYVQLNTILRYIFQSNPSIKPYINFGVGNAFIITENKNNAHNLYSFGNEENVKAIKGPRKYEFSPLAGAGLVVRNIQMELRYAANKKGFSPYNSLDVNPVSFQFIFTYQF